MKSKMLFLLLSTIIIPFISTQVYAQEQEQKRIQSQVKIGLIYASFEQAIGRKTSLELTILPISDYGWNYEKNRGPFRVSTTATLHFKEYFHVGERRRRGKPIAGDFGEYMLLGIRASTKPFNKKVEAPPYIGFQIGAGSRYIYKNRFTVGYEVGGGLYRIGKKNMVPGLFWTVNWGVLLGKVK